VPAVKVTGPFGVTVGDEILAVKVTASPCVDGFGDEVSSAVLVVCKTTWLRTVDLPGGLLASPPYTAISGYGSAFNNDFVRVAPPLLSSIAEPMVNRSHVNFTLPVGINLPEGLTIAVNVTLWP